MRRSTVMMSLSVAVFGLVAALVMANLFSVSILGVHYQSQTDLQAYSQEVNLQRSVVFARRGTLYDTNLTILAEDVRSYTLYAIVDPTRPSMDGQQAYVSDFSLTAQQLAPILHLSEDYILDRLSSADYQTEFGPKGSDLTLAQKQAIEALELPGLGFTETLSRLYPQGSFASHLLGFVNDDDQTPEKDAIGRMGLEAYLNGQLTGKNGFRIATVDSQGYVLPGAPERFVEAQNGRSVVLTIDKPIQDQLQLSLNQAQSSTGASKVWGTVVEVKTGKILGIGQTESFDLNLANPQTFLNYTSQLLYEPGSTMKTFTYAAAIEEGVYENLATFNSAPFYYTISNGKIKRLASRTGALGTIRNVNNKNWGDITFEYAYAVSANVGVASLLSDYLDPEIFKKYLNKFHFFETVDTDITPETLAVGNITSLSDLLHVSFGQGISINMLQLVQAYTAIMNGGVMMKPYVIDRIVDSTTLEVYQQMEPTVVGQPISESTAQSVVDLMRTAALTPGGGVSSYALSSVDVFGKTGTAQIYVDGEYVEDEYIYSIVIGMPYDDPQYLVYVALQGMINSQNGVLYREAVKATLNAIVLHKLNPQNGNSDVLSTVFVPRVINHSLIYALSQFSTLPNPLVVIGAGTSVIQQVPSALTPVLSNQRLFLLTSKTNVLMPDLSGWSKKDALTFFSLIDAQFVMDGTGMVRSQSVLPGTIINPDEVILVTLTP
jgi:penicillin-binding protein 2B